MGIIHIVGLGSGSVDALPFGTMRLLEAGHPVYVRTARHPVMDFLREKGIPFQAFDRIYDSAETFDEVYDRITDELFERCTQDKELVYAVPGHPAVAEKTVRLLIERSPMKNHEIVLGPGQSFLDDLWLRIGVDPITGFTLLDVDDIDAFSFSPRHHLVIVQMYDRQKATDAKLALSQVYGDDHEVVVARAVGVAAQEKIERIPLYELDRLPYIDHLTTLYVPPKQNREKPIGEWVELLQIVDRLRSPEGCPWDMEQTHQSLRPYMIEEAYEAVHAIDEDEPEEIAQELGDVLLQVVLHSQIAKEEGDFDARDVVRLLSEKLIRRHPHVFGDVVVANANEVTENWKKIKQEEKRTQMPISGESLLSEVRKGMPPFVESRKLQKLAASVGFDWPEMDAVYAKVKEEWTEFLQAKTKQEKLDEFGDVLFTLVNVARWQGIDPDEALRMANRKFRDRFYQVEQQLFAQSKGFSDVSLAILDEFWQNAKVKAQE